MIVGDRLWRALDCTWLLRHRQWRHNLFWLSRICGIKLIGSLYMLICTYSALPFVAAWAHVQLLSKLPLQLVMLCCAFSLCLLSLLLLDELKMGLLSLL